MSLMDGNPDGDPDKLTLIFFRGANGLDDTKDRLRHSLVV